MASEPTIPIDPNSDVTTPPWQRPPSTETPTKTPAPIVPGDVPEKE